MMARPLRFEFAGALFHVLARGSAPEDIYSNDANRLQLARTESPKAQTIY
jgi:hypothetical protein